MRQTAAACALLLAGGLLAGDAWALALGRASVQSALGDPLRAQVDIPSITPEEASSLQVSVAPLDAFRAASMDFNGVLNDVRITLMRKADGRPYLQISSTRPVNEPFLDLILEANSTAGKLLRGYTLLLDPPNLKPAAAPMPPAASTAAAPSRPAATPAPMPAPAPAAAPVAAPAMATPGTGSVTVKSGDTAGRIANANKPVGASLDQMLLAILRNNPDAFVKDNVNRLKAGAVLEMPSSDEVNAIDADEARRTIAAQARDFNAFRQQLAARAAPAPDAGDQRAVSGQVQTEVTEASPTASAEDKLTLSKGGVATKDSAEAQLAAKREQADQDARQAELARNVEELAKLQGELGKTAGAAAAGSPAAAPAATEAAPVGVAVEAAAPPAPPPVQPQPTPKPKPKPAPAPPPTPEPSFLDELLANPLLLPAGGVLAALLAGVALLRLRKKKSGDMGESTFPESGAAQDDSFFDASGGQKVDTSADADPQEASSLMYSPSQLDAAGDVDAVAEADVYLAYGRDLQAEEILKEALRTQPERTAIHVKLLEIYAKRNDKATFEATAAEVYTLTGGSGDEWAHVCELGSKIDPGNALYQGTPAAPGPASEATQAMPAFKPSQPPAEAPAPPPPMDLDLDFSQLPEDAAEDETPAEPTLQMPAVEAAAEPAPAPADDNSLNFEMDLGTPEPAAPPTPTAEPAAEDSGMSLEFDLDLGGDAPAAPPPPAPAPAADDVADLGFDLQLDPGIEEAPAAPSVAKLPDEIADLSLDLDMPAEDASPELDDIHVDEGGANPLETKLSLAEEFMAIGDVEGARALAEEVLAEADGELKDKAQAFIDSLD